MSLLVRHIWQQEAQIKKLLDDYEFLAKLRTCVEKTELDWAWPLFILFLTYLLVVVFILVLYKAPRFWRPKMKTTMSQTTDTCGVGFEAEKMVDGSVFKGAKSPIYQCEISGFGSCTWVHSGQGFRVKNTLITANHVIESFSQLRLKGPKGTIEVSKKRFKLVEGDLAKMTLSTDEISRMGLKSAKLNTHEVSANSGLFVEVAAFGKSSMGLVTPHEAFGFVYYQGSTAKGFSGAPYTVGNTVYGMHLGGGGGNMGYDAAYISMLIVHDNEDSEDYVYDQVLKYKSYDYQRSPYDPDEFRLRVNGRYFLVDADMIHKIEFSQAGRNRKVDYADYEAEALEFPPTKFDTIVPLQKELPKESVRDELMEVQEQLKSLIGEFSGNDQAPARKTVRAGATGLPSKAPRVVPTRNSKTEPQQTSTPRQILSLSDGRQLTRAQLNEVLANTSKSLKTLRATLPQFSVATSKKSLQDQQESSNAGRLISLYQKIDEILSTSGLKEDSPTSTTEVQQVTDRTQVP